LTFPEPAKNAEEALQMHVHVERGIGMPKPVSAAVYHHWMPSMLAKGLKSYSYHLIGLLSEFKYL
jgi:hypothetical protein